MVVSLILLTGLLKDATASADLFKTELSPPVAVVASWYGEEFQGRLMANGEVFDKNDPTIVAHKTLPFGTPVILRNPQNGRTITAFVRDRGPYKKGRAFDLSEAAAHELDFKEAGVVRLEAVIFKTD
jgi:rare lipoprotein A